MSWMCWPAALLVAFAIIGGGLGKPSMPATWLHFRLGAVWRARANPLARACSAAIVRRDKSHL